MKLVVASVRIARVIGCDTIVAQVDAQASVVIDVVGVDGVSHGRSHDVDASAGVTCDCVAKDQVDVRIVKHDADAVAGNDGRSCTVGADQIGIDLIHNTVAQFNLVVVVGGDHVAVSGTTDCVATAAVQQDAELRVAQRDAAAGVQTDDVVQNIVEVRVVQQVDADPAVP